MTFGSFVYGGFRQTTKKRPTERSSLGDRDDRPRVPRPCSVVRSWNHNDRSCRQARVDCTPSLDATVNADDRPSTHGQFQTRADRLFSLIGHLTVPSRSPTPSLCSQLRNSLRCSIDDRHRVPRPDSDDGSLRHSLPSVITLAILLLAPSFLAETDRVAMDHSAPRVRAPSRSDRDGLPNGLSFTMESFHWHSSSLAGICHNIPHRLDAFGSSASRSLASRTPRLRRLVLDARQVPPHF